LYLRSRCRGDLFFAGNIHTAWEDDRFRFTPNRSIFPATRFYSPTRINDLATSRYHALMSKGFVLTFPNDFDWEFSNLPRRKVIGNQNRGLYRRTGGILLG